MSGSQQFCTFYIGRQMFGIEVEVVQEIIRFQEITRVPLAPPLVHGLINLRGQIVTAIGLGTLLSLPSNSSERPRMNVIVRGAESSFSLLVDRIGDVLELDESMCEMPPITLDDAVSEVIDRAYKLETELLLSIDVTRLLRRISQAAVVQAA